MTTTRNLKDPGTPVRSERAKVRRQILIALRDVVSTLRWLITVWNVGRQQWGGDYASPSLRPDGVPYTQGWRWRLWHEYPENNPADLRRAAGVLRAIASTLLNLAADIAGEVDAAGEAAAERARQAGKP